MFTMMNAAILGCLHARQRHLSGFLQANLAEIAVADSQREHVQEQRRLLWTRAQSGNGATRRSPMPMLQPSA